MGRLRHLLFSAVVGCLLSFGQVHGLCSDMQFTCEERGRDVENRLQDHPDALYIHCEMMVAIVGCIEEYLCTCNVTISAKADQTFTSTISDYLTTCHNASSHTLRQSTRLKCMEGKPLPVDIPDDPEVDLEVEDTLSRADIEELDGRLLRECQPYAHCSQVYHNALQLASYITNAQQRFAALCLANRLNIVCMSDAFCACDEGNNDLLQKTMEAIRLGHEKNCQEQITVPILQCAASASLLMTPGTGILLLSALLQMVVTSL